jgi:hypothetical protein
MTEDRHWHPDLLRRFVPTPFVFSVSGNSQQTHIESNDLDIAIGIRRFAISSNYAGQDKILFCKVVRDITCCEDGSELLVLMNGAIRMLQRGSKTILIYDEERAELFGFVARDVKVELLVSFLIPAVLSAGRDQ